MAKFTSKSIEFLDYQKAIFGTNDDSAIYWDGTLSDMRITTTISGVYPVQDYHLTTKQYVDDQIGGIDEFIEMVDTPSSYIGSEDKYARVNPTGTGLIFAPAIVGTTSTGTTPPADSNLWYNETLNEFFYYDPVRDEWLSLTVHNYLYTRQGNVDGLFLSVGDLRHADAHYFIPRPAIITAVISSSEQIFNSAKGFEITSSSSGTIYSFSQTGWEFNDMAADIQVEENDQLRIFCTTSGDKCRNPAVTLEVRWRFV